MTRVWCFVRTLRSLLRSPPECDWSVWGRVKLAWKLAPRLIGFQERVRAADKERGA